MAEILYLTHDGLTDPLGQSQILPYLRELSRKGFSIAIVSFEKPDRMKSDGERIASECKNANLQWIPLAYHNQPPVLSTLAGLSKLRSAARELHRTHRFRLIHCRSYVTGLVARRLSQEWNIPFVFDMRGFWADERKEGGHWNIGNPIFGAIYRFFKKEERLLLSQASAVITLTSAAKEVILKWKITSSPIYVIPTCVDLNHFNPTNINEADIQTWRSRLNIDPPQPVLLYLGSIGTWYMLDEMFACFTHLLTRYPNLIFLIVTRDEVPTHIRNHPSVRVTEADRKQVPQLISLSNASLCFIRPGFSKTGSSATKVAEVLAMDVPVISNAGWGDMDRFANQVSLVQAMTPDQFDQAWSSSQTRKGFRNFAVENFSLEQGVSSYVDVYSALLKRD